jgi:hypothetical protein
MSLHHVIPSNLKGSQGSSGSGVLDGVVILVCGKGEAVSRCKALQRQTKTNIFFFFFRTDMKTAVRTRLLYPQSII